MCVRCPRDGGNSLITQTRRRKRLLAIPPLFWLVFRLTSLHTTADYVFLPVPLASFFSNWQHHYKIPSSVRIIAHFVHSKLPPQPPFLISPTPPFCETSSLVSNIAPLLPASVSSSTGTTPPSLHHSTPFPVPFTLAPLPHHSYTPMCNQFVHLDALPKGKFKFESRHRENYCAKLRCHRLFSFFLLLQFPAFSSLLRLLFGSCFRNAFVLNTA